MKPPLITWKLMHCFSRKVGPVAPLNAHLGDNFVTWVSSRVLPWPDATFDLDITNWVWGHLQMYDTVLL